MHVENWAIKIQLYQREAKKFGARLTLERLIMFYKSFTAKKKKTRASGHIFRKTKV